MIAFNPNVRVICDRDFAEVFQGLLPEIWERYGYNTGLAAEVAVEKTRQIVYGDDDQCEWDGDWPKVEDGQIIRTPEYFELERQLREKFART